MKFAKFFRAPTLDNDCLRKVQKDKGKSQILDYF